MPTSAQIEKKTNKIKWIDVEYSFWCYRCWKMSSCLTYVWLWVTRSSSSWWGWWPPRGCRRRWSIHWCAQSHHQPRNQHRVGYYGWHLHFQYKSSQIRVIANPTIYSPVCSIHQPQYDLLILSVSSIYILLFQAFA